MKRKIISVVAMALLLAIGTPVAASALEFPNVQEIFDKKTFKASDGYELNYRIHLPDDYSPDKEYPMLLFLHGAGAKGNDNEKQLTQGVQQMFTYSAGKVSDSIVIAPQCPLLSPDTAKWVNVSDWVSGCNYDSEKIAESQQMKAVVELLDYIRENYSTDESRWYVTGLSMGGFATWDMIVRHPELWAAAVPLCGGADYRKASVIKDLPIWTFHGDEDPTVPIRGTEQMVNALKDAGSTTIKYNKLSGQKHDIWNGVYSYTIMWNWLYEQKKEMPAETEPVVTEPVETKPVTDTTPDVTEPAPKENGCFGSIGASALAVAAVAGGATAMAKKKKKK